MGFRLRWPEDQSQYLRTLPKPAFARLMVAAFLAASAMALGTDLTSFLQRPFWFTLTMAAIFGALFALVLAVGRRRGALWLAVPAIVLLAVASRAMKDRIPLDRTLFSPGLEGVRLRIALDGGLSMAGAILAFSILLRLTSTEVARHIRTRAELALAEQVQQSLAPPLAMKSAGYEVQGRSAPSSQMGGDLLDAVDQDGAIAVYVSDVAGHGIQAGVFMGMVKSSVRMALLRCGPLSDLLGDLNRVVFDVKTTPATYVTFACVRCVPSGQVEYSLAGSGPMLHYRAGSKTTSQLAMEQFPLGMFAKATFQSGTVQIDPGDILAVMTDGIPEAVDANDEQFGLDRIGKMLTANPTGPLAELVESIFTAVRRHGPQTDDETLVLVRSAA